jgi:hypothetical protein
LGGSVGAQRACDWCSLFAVIFASDNRTCSHAPMRHAQSCAARCVQERKGEGGTSMFACAFVWMSLAARDCKNGSLPKSDRCKHHLGSKMIITYRAGAIVHLHTRLPVLEDFVFRRRQVAAARDEHAAA